LVLSATLYMAVRFALMRIDPGVTLDHFVHVASLLLLLSNFRLSSSSGTNLLP